ncbi:glycosyltransferase family 4 protein [Trichothermofontia sichuanensis B231]|uniref:glycosyltransferase family 4 protein n=1 Tax=Trichothermofontia sichuanensis TaxID=3045816 RepID=UPI002245AD39|nr:glycosyltransferase family 4 protein [Trichothermofontia sichuanensis]UZQ55317.1 glycosyltransferase family 4 protein [Trichothermofontia sichuanensis B231]
MNRFIVIQTGARRNYAVPSILAKADMLEVLYTDLCADDGIGQWLERYCPKFLRHNGIRRLLERKVPHHLAGKVETCDWIALRYLIAKKLAANNPLKQHHALSLFNQAFGQAAINKGLGGATHIFSMFGEGTPFLEYAKQNGLKVITEIYISPATDRIVQSERDRFPELEPKLPDEIIEKNYQYFQKVCQLTDIFIVPSSFVEQGLKEFGVESSQCRTVPYAVNDDWFKLENKPIKGRVLFVGTAELRKGIHILGQAAQKLAQRGYEFRVAGNVSELVHSHPITQCLTFLGRISRSEIQSEYTQADIFVLPSLAEGSAEVTYEALASGLPVITTTSSGSVVRDGIDGFIVPVKDPDILATRIEELIENRELRTRMSKSAKQRAKEYDMDNYTQRLISTLIAV